MWDWSDTRRLLDCGWNTGTSALTCRSNYSWNRAGRLRNSGTVWTAVLDSHRGTWERRARTWGRLPVSGFPVHSTSKLHAQVQGNAPRHHLPARRPPPISTLRNTQMPYGIRRLAAVQPETILNSYILSPTMDRISPNHACVA